MNVIVKNSEELEWISRVRKFQAGRESEKLNSVRLIKSIAAGESPLFSENEASVIFANLRIIGYDTYCAEILLRHIAELAEWIDVTKDQYISEFFCIIEDKEKALRVESEDRGRILLELTLKSDFNDFERRLLAAIEKHKLILLKKRRQMLLKNEYGVVKGMDKWVREIHEFIDDVVYPPVHSSLDYITYAKKISKLLDSYSSEHSDAVDVEKMTGNDFELHCAVILKDAGWIVLHRGKTGDQGVDLIAELNGLKVAIQCKRYAGAVGNTAVQEVFAGRGYEECNMAVVVSNARFTTSALQLAQTLKVLLIDISELGQLHSLIRATKN